MIRYILFVVAAALIFSSCQSENNQEKSPNNSSSNAEDVKISETYCYAFIKDNDTARLNYISTNGITTGELSYNLYQKDKNNGILEGEIKGDTLIADYIFESEGSESVREVVFLMKNNELIEGFGEVEEKDGKTIFKNRSKLIFGNSIVFKKVDCQ